MPCKTVYLFPKTISRKTTVLFANFYTDKKISFKICYSFFESWKCANFVRVEPSYSLVVMVMGQACYTRWAALRRDEGYAAAGAAGDGHHPTRPQHHARPLPRQDNHQHTLRPGRRQVIIFFYNFTCTVGFYTHFHINHLI